MVFGVAMEEVLSKRTEISKTYSLGKGQYRLDIGGVQHYKDDYSNPKEQWKDIDLTIVDGRITHAPYELTIDYDHKTIIMRDKRTGSITTISLLSVGGSPIGSIGAPIIEKNVITWKSAAVGTDIAIEAGPTSVKFKRVLSSGSAPLEAKFSISQTGTGIALKCIARDADSECIPVQESIKDGVLTETVNSLDLVAKQYPISVDPSLTIQPSSKDTRIHEGNPTTNYGSESDFRTSAPFYSGNTQRALCEFSISWGVDIPAGATLTAATLYLYYFDYGAGDDPQTRTIYADRLIRLDWVELEATWNIYKAASNWTTAGCGSDGNDYEDDNRASDVVPGSWGWMDWDVLAQVQWAQTNNTNIGFCLRDSDEPGGLTHGYAVRWYSLDEAVETTKRPKITITYTLAGGGGLGSGMTSKMVAAGVL